jgi:hypothetical protein
MPIALPLTVRIKSQKADTDITEEINGLRFKSQIPGGFATLSISLNRPLDLQPDDVDYYSTLFVYDGRNGNTVWEGRLEDPGRSAGSDGEVWAISATGSYAHAQDQFLPLIYVDRMYDGWKRSRYSTHGSYTDQTEAPDTLTGNTDEDANNALTIYANEGSTVTTGWCGDFIYRAPRYGGQVIARIRADFVCEGASTNYRAQMRSRVNADAATAVAGGYIDLPWVTTPDIIAANFASGLPTDTNVVSLRAVRNNSNTTADALARVYFYNVVVRCAIKNVDGTDNFSLVGYNVNNIDPNEVVADLLGRCLPKFDGPNATIIGSGVDIEQLAYPDGITPAQVLEDISVFDPGFYWAAWESASFNAASKTRNRFQYIPWPTTIRYEASVEDGFDSPGSAVDLYNKVNVRYLDPNNVVRNVTRTQSVPELTAQGLTRTEYIDISSEMGTKQNATYVGDNFLAEHRYPPNAGTLTVARPILDQNTARMVMPWEIVPGHLIRVRGVLPRVDSLNPTDRDGVTVFRVISAEFDSDSGSVSLELDSMSRTVAAALANLANKRIRRR